MTGSVRLRCTVSVTGLAVCVTGAGACVAASATGLAAWTAGLVVCSTAAVTGSVAWATGSVACSTAAVTGSAASVAGLAACSTTSATGAAACCTGSRRGRQHVRRSGARDHERDRAGARDGQGREARPGTLRGTGAWDRHAASWCFDTTFPCRSLPVPRWSARGHRVSRSSGLRRSRAWTPTRSSKSSGTPVRGTCSTRRRCSGSPTTDRTASPSHPDRLPLERQRDRRLTAATAPKVKALSSRPNVAVTIDAGDTPADAKALLVRRIAERGDRGRRPRRVHRGSDEGDATRSRSRSSRARSGRCTTGWRASRSSRRGRGSSTSAPAACRASSRSWWATPSRSRPRRPGQRPSRPRRGRAMQRLSTTTRAAT